MFPIYANLNYYGSDLGSDFPVALLRVVCRVPLLIPICYIISNL